MAILDYFRKPAAKTTSVSMAGATPKRVSGKYDSAQTTDANSGYWANADGLSARLANAPGVRKVIRERARYEWANNCYAKGMIRTDADYVVGTGPRLQVLTDDDEYNREVERLFHQWARQVRFGRKLWTMRSAWIRDGESFGMFVTNGALRDPVKVDLQLIECDQIADDLGEYTLDIRRDDGLVLDEFGNVVAYKVWPTHPGDGLLMGLGGNSEVQTIPARDMIHLFRVERPGQMRGVSEIAPALMLYPTMRKWTYAALGAAEKAARIAGVIKSTFNSTSPAEIAAMEDIYLEADSFLTMPEGWDITQLRSEQPAAQYDMFKRQIVSEIARCLNMPYNIAAADSSDYNFASGKLDHLGWFKSVSVDHSQCDSDACTPAFERWFYEAKRIPGYLPPGGDFEYPPHVWFWDGQDTIDPREAGAKDIGLKNGTETLARVWAKKGLDAEQELRTNAKILGMSFEDYQEAIRANLFGGGQTLPAPEETDESEEQAEERAAA